MCDLFSRLINFLDTLNLTRIESIQQVIKSLFVYSHDGYQAKHLTSLRERYQQLGTFPKLLTIFWTMVELLQYRSDIFRFQGRTLADE